MKVAYILDQFPALSETFIRREIQALEQAYGIEIAIFALRGVAPGDPGCGELHHAAFYRRPTSSLCALAALGRRPGVFLRGLRATGIAGTRWIGTAAAFAQAARQDDVGHVHAHFASIPTLIAELVATHLGCRFSFSAHARDIYTQTPTQLRRRLEAATFVAACTRHGLDRLRSCLPAGAPAAATALLIRHGIPLAQFPPRVSPPSLPPLLLAVGRLEPKKGFDVLVRACAKLAAERTDFRCVLIGGGSQQRQLQAAVATHGLGARVLMPGPLNEAEVRRYMQEATLLALPSVEMPDGDRDGLPNVLLEAWATGIPVVTSTASAAAEVVIDGVNGRLVPPGNAEHLAAVFTDLLARPEHCAAMGRAGRQLVERGFDAVRNAAPLADAFRNALAANAKQPPCR